MTASRGSWSADDPLWYKDAVIYELNVRGFFDGSGDGIGDLAGLTSKLDYIADLGVTALWLLPFYPSPLRDGGYDISDYTGVHPDVGSLADVRTFLAEAHKRGLRVITELVVNHTSDQHPWFVDGRSSRTSAHRDWYVWSDHDGRYPEARIIFTDTEASNWAWDAQSGAYYWHRFFSHQPDLNWDNPKVFDEVLAAMRYWLDMGVDGLRLDAVPYLIERDGTSCENVPETHRILRRLRGAVDERHPGRMLLAEANQWPEDVLPYFGDGDECHMAFHFPLMPRIWVALRREDPSSIVEILEQTPPIPAECQWAVFLRNHDELTLEMVTEEERDFLWTQYAPDPRARLNLGIRRRLAPLAENDRAQIELLNGILLSMPGTPVIYYGDEIGMGDNIALPDRDGVRTPMQWSGERNAGFSTADPASLYLPVIADPEFGPGAVNVAAQERDPGSLLGWMRQVIGLRQRNPAFGRGSLEFLRPDNRAVLAYLRQHEGVTILCVANFSRAEQPVELDLGRFAGRVPVEMMSNAPYPKIEAGPYSITLDGRAFRWFLLTDGLEPA
jgi:maltose alpha-D-glucosyltransferase / alpha-amylase